MELLLAFAIPGLVFFLMFVVGLDLTVADLRRVIEAPVFIALATLGQLVILPAIAAGLIVLLDPDPRLAAGMVLVAASSSGAVSNTFTLVAGANVGLSVTLTAISSLLSLVTMPLLTAFGFRWLIAEHAGFESPIGPMVGQLLGLMVTPVAIGMIVRHRWPAQSTRSLPVLVRLSAAGVMGLVGLVVVSQWSAMRRELVEVASLALGFTLLAMGAGYGLGIVLRRNRADRFTLMFELGSRNLAIVIVVASQALGRLDVVVFAVAFFLVAGPIALFAAAVHRRSSPSEVGQGDSRAENHGLD